MWNNDAIQEQISRIGRGLLPKTANATLCRAVAGPLNALGEPLAPAEQTWPIAWFPLKRRRTQTLLVPGGAQLIRHQTFLLGFIGEAPTEPALNDIVVTPDGSRVRITAIIRQDTPATHWKAEGDLVHV
ncbi:hypothetical protein GC173_11520 [bacterium]|nr:hypothetical protein [bacterium]